MQLVTAFAVLALPLLVARVVADDHDPAVAPDDPALAADLLDARLDLHGKLSSWPAVDGPLSSGHEVPGCPYLYR